MMVKEAGCAKYHQSVRWRKGCSCSMTISDAGCAKTIKVFGGVKAARRLFYFAPNWPM